MEIDFPHGKKLRLVIGDITRIRVDAIVNAANAGLRGGGGVDGAVHRAGGPTIMRELDEIRANSGGCPTGSAVVPRPALSRRSTFSTRLVRFIGMASMASRSIWPSCYRNCLELAEEHGVRTISFPAISTGVYGYPVEEAAADRTGCDRAALCEKPECEVREVLLVLFEQGFYDHSRAHRHRPTS